MNPDRKRIYAVTALFPAVLLLVLFVPDITTAKLLLAGISVGFAAAAWLLIPKRSAMAVPRREVLLVMAVMAPLLVMIYYLTGLRFGFYRTPVQSHYLTKYIIPFLLAIPGAEVLRWVLLQQKRKTVTAVTYAAMVLLDCILYASTNMLDTFQRVLSFGSLVLLPAVTGNLLYHYLSPKYGPLPNIVYRLVLALYPYIFSTAPGTPSAMLAFGRMVAPVLVLLFIHRIYEKRTFAVSRQKNLWHFLGGAVLLTAMALIIMLISCQFRYGLLVVGSESMTGAIDKGDAIIYESYTDQVISTGEVIVFRDGKTQYIHRVADVKYTDGELRYYTKGDINDTVDPGYVTRDELVGVVQLTVKHIGYPTIWLRELFQ